MDDMRSTYPSVDAEINAATVAVLRSVISARRLSQKKIAESLGMSPVTVSRYLNGHRDVPLALVFGVAEASGIPASDLIERIGRELADPLI